MEINYDEKNVNIFGKRKREQTTTTTTTTSTTPVTTTTTTTAETGIATDQIIATDDEPPKKRVCSPPSPITLTLTSQITTTTTTSTTSTTSSETLITSEMMSTETLSASSDLSLFASSTNFNNNHNELNDPSNGISKNETTTTTRDCNDDKDEDNGGDDGGGGSSHLYEYYHQRYRRHENPYSYNLKIISNNDNNNNNNNSNNIDNKSNYNNSNNNNNNNEKNINKPNHNNSNEKLQIKVSEVRSSALSTSSSSLPSSPEPECFDDVDLIDSTNDTVQNCDTTATLTARPTTRRSTTMATTVIAPNDIRVCPLPPLSWAESSEVWNLMIKKDERAAFERSSSMFNNHKAIAPRMRAILLDWLIEVCEVYKLHRETYYLAIDYLDRYLNLSVNIPKARLQLIGITCLFVAAKVEEIYPPKIGEFAYVTDGACKDEDIIQEERILLNVLQWQITPVTIMGWLSVYMQVNVSNRMPSVMTRSMTAAAATATSTLFASPTRQTTNDLFLNNPSNSSSSSTTFSNNKTPIKMKTRQQTLTSYLTSISSPSTTNSPSPSSSSSLSAINKHFLTPPSIKKSIKSKVPDTATTINKYDESFVYPQFSGLEFCQTAQLIDLCSLDHEIANYQYSVIAAAAISHTLNRETSMNVSGLDWDVIDGCAKWMLPYYLTICEEISPMHLLEQNEPNRATYGLSHLSKNINTNEMHVLQTHSTTLDMFDKSTDRVYSMIMAGMRKSDETPTVKSSAIATDELTSHATLESTPLIHGKIIDKTYLTGLLTPPTSNGKPSSEDTQIH